ALQTIYFQWKWPQLPTTHFTLSHAVDLAIDDGGAFLTLQEGAESVNGALKQEAHSTFNGLLEQVINHRNLRFLLNMKYEFTNNEEPTRRSFNMYIQLFEIFSIHCNDELYRNEMNFEKFLSFLFFQKE